MVWLFVIEDELIRAIRGERFSQGMVEEGEVIEAKFRTKTRYENLTPDEKEEYLNSMMAGAGVGDPV